MMTSPKDLKGDFGSGPLAAPGARPPAVPPPHARPVAAPDQVASATRLGIILMITVSLVFAIQDGMSRYLGGNYSPMFIVMVRYWFFAVFVLVLAARSPGGIGAAARSKRPWTQIARGFLLVAEIVVIIEAFVRLGLIGTHAIFACYPLLISALSGPILGERVGWRRWAAVGVGFAGILIILQPGVSVFSPWAILPLISALMFATYGLLTRHVARDDPASVSFFWTAMSGFVFSTLIGVWHWESVTPTDWLLLGGLCISAIAAHWLLIRAYELAEASALQPFAYLQLVFVSIIGVAVFGETLTTNVVIGAAIVVSAGLFTLWRARVRAGQSG